jgi:hypothetical protein
VGLRSRTTGEEFVQTPLLYPVTHKDYNQSEFITHEWERLKVWLGEAKRFTIFGYGAPVTDVEAVDLMSSAWGNPRERNMEQIDHRHSAQGNAGGSVGAIYSHTPLRMFQQLLPVLPGFLPAPHGGTLHASIRGGHTWRGLSGAKSSAATL